MSRVRRVVYLAKEGELWVALELLGREASESDVRWAVGAQLDVYENLIVYVRRPDLDTPPDPSSPQLGEVADVDPLGELLVSCPHDAPNALPGGYSWCSECGALSRDCIARLPTLWWSTDPSEDLWWSTDPSEDA